MQIPALAVLVFCYGVTDLGASEDSILDFQESLIESGKTGSNVFKVFGDGRTIYEQIVNSGLPGDRHIDENTVFAIHSMTKTVTTVAAMILFDRGLFDLEDNLHEYLPEFKDVNCKGPEGVYPCKNKIKVIDLMTHRSGYLYYADNGDYWLTSTHRQLYPKYINTSRFRNLEDFSVAVSRQPLEFEPGSMYGYGLNQALLGRFIEVVAGQSFFGFMEENIFDKLGMSETKFHLTDEDRKKLQPLRVNIKAGSAFNQTDYHLDGYTSALDGYSYLESNRAHFGGEGLVSTMNDFSKFCEMLLNKGIFNGQRIVSEESIELMTSKYTNSYPDPNEPYVFPDLAGNFFGFTFSVLENKEEDGTGAGLGTYGWSGYHNTHFWIDPENRVYGLFMSRAIEFDFGIKKGLKRAVYSSGLLKNHSHGIKKRR